MNKITICLLVIIMALCFSLGTAKQSRAQDKSYTGILPFVTSNDRVGFLDQNSGRVYIYDNNLTNCLFVGQIQSLGQPIEVVANTPVSTINQ